MQNGGYYNLEHPEQKKENLKKNHFPGVTKTIRQNAEIRLYTLPGKKNGFYANNYLFTILVLFFILLLCIIYYLLYKARFSVGFSRFLSKT